MIMDICPAITATSIGTSVSDAVIAAVGKVRPVFCVAGMRL